MKEKEHKHSKDVHKEQMKDPDLPATTRVAEAGKAVGEKVKEELHGVAKHLRRS